MLPFGSICRFDCGHCFDNYTSCTIKAARVWYTHTQCGSSRVTWATSHWDRSRLTRHSGVNDGAFRLFVFNDVYFQGMQHVQHNTLTLCWNLHLTLELDGVSRLQNNCIVVHVHVGFFGLFTVPSNPCLPCRPAPKVKASSKTKQSSPGKR